MPVKEIIPKEGATGWLDTWMLSSKAKHPNCAYKWYQYISSPKVQAHAGDRLTGRRRSTSGVRGDEQASARARAPTYHANAPESYYRVDQVLEDAGGGLRQRPEELHGLLEVG